MTENTTTAQDNRLYAAEQGIECAECGHGDVEAMATEGCGCCRQALHAYRVEHHANPSDR